MKGRPLLELHRRIARRSSHVLKPGHSGGLKLFARIVIAGCVLVFPVPAAAEDDTESASIERNVPFGPADLPAYQPTWEPLPKIRSALKQGVPSAASEHLRRALSEFGGRLIPTTPQTIAPDGWLRIPPPGEALHDWLREVDAKHELRLRIARDADPHDAHSIAARPLSTDPILWAPGLGLSGGAASWQGELEQARQLAWERGDLATANLLSRVGGAADPHRQALRSWLRSERIAQHDRLSAPRSTWRATCPQLTAVTVDSATSARTTAEPRTASQKLRLVARHPLELTPNPSLRARGRRDVETTDKHPLRRAPLAAIYPLVRDGAAIFETGRRVFELETNAKMKRIWTRAAPESGDSRHALSALLLNPIAPVPYDDGWLLSWRTRRTETKNGSTTYLLIGGVRELQQPFNRLYAGTRAKDGEAPTRLRELRPTLDIASIAGEQREDHLPGGLAPLSALSAGGAPTRCGTPLVVGDIAYVPYFVGFREVDLILAAFDLNAKQDAVPILWQRTIAHRHTAWMSMQDLRNYLPDIEVESYGGELLITNNLGWITRLGRERGDFRGAWFYPRHAHEEYFTGTRARMRGFDIRQLPEPRPRYPSTPVIVERPGKSPLWIVLPRDSRKIIAIDLDTWKIEWTQHADLGTQVLGWHEGRLIVIDSGIAVGDHRMTLRQIDAQGKHVVVTELALACEQSKRKDGDVDRAGPLLVGVPTVVDGELWVPTLKGLELWTIGASENDTEAPHRVIEWPIGAAGGTPVVLPDGRILTTTRGDEGLLRLGYIELFTLGAR